MGDIIKPRILLVRNQYDKITHYMFEWSVPVKELAEKKGIDVDCIDGQYVVKSEIISRVEKLKHNFIFLNGHGNSETFFGYENKEALGLKDAKIFENKIVFSRSCDCAKKLGKEAVTKHNCTSFIGYEYEFVNVRQTDFEMNPRKDEISRPIWETSNIVATSLIKGATVNESLEASHRRATTEILKLLYSLEEPGSVETLKAVMANDDCLKYHGNGSAKIL